MINNNPKTRMIAKKLLMKTKNPASLLNCKTIHKQWNGRCDKVICMLCCSTVLLKFTR